MAAKWSLSGALRGMFVKPRIDDDTWDETIGINLNGMFYAGRAAARVMIVYNRSRSSAVTVFESQTRAIYRLLSRTTAAATTGPARHPRPTSSQPAT